MSKRKTINGYTLLGDFSTSGGGQCRWTFAERSGEVYFLKEFLTPKFPQPDGPGSPSVKEVKRQRCLRFEHHHQRMKDAICSAVGRGGNLVAVLDFFRSGTMYYKVTEKVDVHADSIDVANIAKLPIERRVLIMKTVAHSLDILHHRIIVHGDLKPDNILIKRKSKDYYIAKLIDFDSSYFAGEPPELQDEIVGDMVYYSPELCLYVQRKGTVRREDLQTASDIFSLGLVFCQYLNGKLPGYDVGKYQYPCNAVADGAKLVIADKGLPRSLVKLIESMLRANPNERPSIKKIFATLKKWDKDESTTTDSFAPTKSKLSGTLIHAKPTLIHSSPAAPARPGLKGSLIRKKKRKK